MQICVIHFSFRIPLKTMKIKISYEITYHKEDKVKPLWIQKSVLMEEKWVKAQQPNG